jgi:predicted secreted hydrolase
MRHWTGVMFIASLLNSSCVHRSLLNADGKALQKADTTHHLQPIARNSLEWWYFNGHLRDSFGREYAFHTALFRRYAFPFRPVWMSNTALADLANDTIIRHYHFYTNREIRRAKDSAFSLHCQSLGITHRNSGWTLGAHEPSFDLRLMGESATPPVPMAEQGIIQFGRKRAGYLSMPWMQWQGSLRLGDSCVLVSGSGWFDRQWSALKLTGSRYTWNWMSLEHDSFRLMVFGLVDRRKDSMYLRATSVQRDGQVQYHAPETWMFEGSEPLENRSDKQQFPQIWQLWIPGMDLKVCMKSRVEDAVITLRALRHPFMSYWEGPVWAWGIYRGEVFQSRGFIELMRH